MAFIQILNIPEDSAWSWAKEYLTGTVFTCSKKDTVKYPHAGNIYFQRSFLLTGDSVLDNGEPICIGFKLEDEGTVFKFLQGSKL